MARQSNGNETREPTMKRMCALMRRIGLVFNSKISFPDFVKLIRPV